MKWFSSDLHLGHKKIAQERGFDITSDSWQLDMNMEIITRVNSSVMEDDEFYILGDLSFMNYESTLFYLELIKCKNIYFIRGNHDGDKIFKNLIPLRFVWIKDYYKLKIEDDDSKGGFRHLVLFHYPMLTWDRAHYGSWHLHGHCHGSLDPKFISTRMDVGWDVWRRPISYEDIKRHLKDREYVVVDHHFYGSEG